MTANAIPMREPDLLTNTQEKGLFASASRINHSCSPNASYYFEESAGKLKVQAVFEISPGEEICHSYISRDYLLSVKQYRQKSLVPLFWGKVCQCRACSDLDSDGRRHNILEAEKQIQYALK